MNPRQSVTLLRALAWLDFLPLSVDGEDCLEAYLSAKQCRRILSIIDDEPADKWRSTIISSGRARISEDGIASRFDFSIDTELGLINLTAAFAVERGKQL